MNGFRIFVLLIQLCNGARMKGLGKSSEGGFDRRVPANPKTDLPNLTESEQSSDLSKLDEVVRALDSRNGKGQNGGKKSKKKDGKKRRSKDVELRPTLRHSNSRSSVNEDDHPIIVQGKSGSPELFIRLGRRGGVERAALTPKSLSRSGSIRSSLGTKSSPPSSYKKRNQKSFDQSEHHQPGRVDSNESPRSALLRTATSNGASNNHPKRMISLRGIAALKRTSSEKSIDSPKKSSGTPTGFSAGVQTLPRKWRMSAKFRAEEVEGMSGSYGGSSSTRSQAQGGSGGEKASSAGGSARIPSSDNRSTLEDPMDVLPSLGEHPKGERKLRRSSSHQSLKSDDSMTILPKFGTMKLYRSKPSVETIPTVTKGDMYIPPAEPRHGRGTLKKSGPIPTLVPEVDRLTPRHRSNSSSTSPKRSSSGRFSSIQSPRLTGLLHSLGMDSKEGKEAKNAEIFFNSSTSVFETNSSASSAKGSTSTPSVIASSWTGTKSKPIKSQTSAFRNKKKHDSGPFVYLDLGKLEDMENNPLKRFDSSLTLDSSRILPRWSQDLLVDGSKDSKSGGKLKKTQRSRSTEDLLMKPRTGKVLELDADEAFLPKEEKKRKLLEIESAKAKDTVRKTSKKGGKESLGSSKEKQTGKKSKSKKSTKKHPKSDKIPRRSQNTDPAANTGSDLSDTPHTDTIPRRMPQKKITTADDEEPSPGSVPRVSDSAKMSPRVDEAEVTQELIRIHAEMDEGEKKRNKRTGSRERSSKNKRVKERSKSRDKGKQVVDEVKGSSAFEPLWELSPTASPTFKGRKSDDSTGYRRRTRHSFVSDEDDPRKSHPEKTDAIGSPRQSRSSHDVFRIGLRSPKREKHLLPVGKNGEPSFRTASRTLLQDGGEIVGATLSELIDIVFELNPELHGTIRDTSIHRAFWRSYYLYIPARDLLRELVRRFEEHNIAENNQRMARRIDEIVRCWIKFYYYGDDDWRFGQLLGRLDKHLGPTRNEPGHISLVARYTERIKLSPYPPPIDGVPFILDVIAAYDKIDLAAKDFALQLSIYTHKWYTSLQPSEFFPEKMLSGAERHSAAGPGGSRKFFQHLCNYHTALADFIQTSVLYAPRHEVRIGTLRYFLDVAQECKARNDYFNLSALLCGLNSGPMQRLKSIWESSSKLTKHLDDAAKGFFPDRREYQRKLAELTEDGNFQTSQNESKPFFIPDLISLSHEVTMTLEGNSAYLSHEHYPIISATDTPLINLHRLRTLDRTFHVLRASQKFRLAAWVRHDPATQNFLALLSRYEPSTEIQEVSYYARAKDLESSSKAQPSMFSNSSADTSSPFSRYFKQSHPIN